MGSSVGNDYLVVNGDEYRMIKNRTARNIRSWDDGTILLRYSWENDGTIIGYGWIWDN